ncbi:hypothetical protein BS47DRAFT_1370235 [Hydnum rufescens UP504]|uniref:PrpF protein n=1 Tax=Hydnum rufescens UP504 TaxID=1448309 RepID=A0A9P6BB92_9AGAM|nr:hypothetical protein BS47DRAFT_1370235 [Hydnum rufescens UP504]
MQRAIRAVFYRGGTSKGLFFRASDPMHLPRRRLDQILLSAMGSPDPDGRQIDGMGGGLSSLSKVAIVSTPGETLPCRPEEGHLPTNDPTCHSFPDGIAWADDVEAASREDAGWDVVYRFAQVGVRDGVVDWGSTCGNLVAAVAHYAVEEGLVNERVLEIIYRNPGLEEFPLTIRILAVDSGKIVRARVQVRKFLGSMSSGSSPWFVTSDGNASISGVPGTSSAVDIENPLHGDILPTGRVLDQIILDGDQIPCTIVDAGLPSIFIPSTAVFPSPQSFLLSPAELDADICVVGPPTPYTSAAGQAIRSEDMDCAIRAVSVGNFHRTVPATMLSALAVAGALQGSIVASHGNARTITVGHPAGVSHATTTLSRDGIPASIAYVRTARRLFQGEVLVRDAGN